jgi:hypothetical protein
MPEGKEKIKSRMIRTASHLWGFNDLQPEDSFDPIVGLLIGACANELEKLSREISDTESRLIEKLVEILLPGPITSPFPSHAIMYARPSKSNLVLHPDYQFYFIRKDTDPQTGKSEDRHFYFTPAGYYQLFDANIKYAAIHSSIYEFTENESKEIILESEQNARLPSTRFWIGLEWNHDLAKIKSIPLFVNARNSYLRELLLHLIPRTSWYFNGLKLDSHPGIPDLPMFSESPLKKLEREFDVVDKILTYINRYYSDHFITLDFSGLSEITESDLKIPEDFKKVFSEKQLDKIDQEILWIEVHSPVVLEEDMAEDFYLYVNAFPVINRSLNEYTGNTRENLNIIPLITEDLFLDLKSVINKSGESYRSELFAGINQLSSGSYLLRHGYIGRFDSMQAKEYLEFLIEMLKDESAAFNVIGSDLLHSSLKELSQAIARLEKKVSETEINRSDSHYLIVQPKKGEDLVFIQFWSTTGSSANRIKSGSRFNIYSGKDLITGSLKLLTTTIGGKERPDREERFNIFRSALLSKNRVVTEGDIKTLCYEQVGEDLDKVSLSKGIKDGASSLQGFIRTIDVSLKLKDSKKFTSEALYEMKKGLLTSLEQRSANVFPYRVFIE